MADRGEEWYGLMDKARKENHARWRDANLAALRASGLSFEEREEACLFREAGKPKVDFYPSTGRWRVVGAGAGQTFRGGAVSFLRWYAKQEVLNA